MNRFVIILIILIFFTGIGFLIYDFYNIPDVVVENGINISAGVVPHHLLAEPLIREFFEEISSNEPKTIVLLGPDHFNANNLVGTGFITVESDRFLDLEVNQTLINNLSKDNDIIFSDSSIEMDHGITNLIPFVKEYFPNSKIAPFIIPFNVSLEQAEKFANSLDSEVIVIASVDFSHYLNSSSAEFHDVKSIRTLLNFEKQFQNIEVDSWQSLYIARAFANLRGDNSFKIIGHKQSKDFTDIIEQGITSYFSVVFEKGEAKSEQVKTILFTGDIMLDRGVEYLMEKNNYLYPFEKIEPFLRGIDIVVGNLEGPINKNPQYFSDKSLMFSFSEKAIEGIKFSHFNLFSLANNHTLNMGKQGLAETREILEKNNINFMGDPLLCNSDYSFEDDIIFLAFNATFRCSKEDIIKAIQEQDFSKFLIVNIHWGNEYESIASSFQQKLAYQMIDAGADLIIGHHPHVVQNIEKYNNKLIFYSLGNFIFDQYFSEETQQGLAIGLEIWPEKLVFRIFPIQSYFSQPSLMESDEFLEELAERSDKELAEDIKKGIIEIIIK